MDTAFLKRDKISYYDYVGKINVNGQVIDLERGDFMVYKQDNSAVAAKYIKQKADSADGNKLKDLQAYEFKVGEVQGKEIAFKDLPQLGRYTYRGIAFNGDDNSGRLTYTIDFEKNKVRAKSAAWRLITMSIWLPLTLPQQVRVRQSTDARRSTMKTKAATV